MHEINKVAKPPGTRGLHTPRAILIPHLLFDRHQYTKSAQSANKSTTMTSMKLMNLFIAILSIYIIKNVNCQDTSTSPSELPEIRRRSFHQFATTERTISFNVTESEPYPEISVADLGASFQSILNQNNGEGVNKIISDHIVDLLKHNISEYAQSKLVSELYHLEIGALKIENYICKKQIQSAIHGARTGQVWALKSKLRLFLFAYLI